VFSFLLTPESVVFSDQPTNISQATHTFSSLDQLKTLLSKTKLPSNVVHIILVSSPSFDLKTLHSLAKEARAVLCFNDKEHFGIAGKRGLGFGAQQKEVDCVIGSFEHASGAPIAYIATSDTIFKEKPYVHPLIPSSLGALDAILNILPDMDAERVQMEKHIGWLQGQLREKGFSVSLGKTPKITISFSREEAAERLWNFFIENDVMLGHLETKQLSFSLTALHTPDDLDQLSTVLKKLSDTDFALSMQSSTPTP
jgi:8-amino-7-oxononanoate synthase